VQLGWNPVAGGPVLASLGLTPSRVVGGTPATGTVTLSAAAPVGGAVVTLSSNNTLVTVPASVTVAAGNTSAAFTATTRSTRLNKNVTLSASWQGKTVTSVLAVTRR
jgi:hypothetical protein